MQVLQAIALFLGCFLASAHGARILLMPFVYTSHIGEFKHIGEALADRGHEVHILLPTHYDGNSKFKSDKSKISLLEYEAIHPDYLMFSEEKQIELFETAFKLTPAEDFRTNYEGSIEICYNVLESEYVEKQVKALKFDLILIDGFTMTRCYYILAYRLGIPYVSVSTQYEPWLYRTPALPSFVPFPFHIPPLSPEMSFWERLSNTWSLLDWSYYTDRIPYLSDDMVTKYAPQKPPVTINDLAGKSLLWLFDTDVSIDYPRPTMPNEINIGGLSVKPSKPLPKDLDAFVSSAKQGTVIASFGSTTAIPEEYMIVMIDAFKMLPKDIHVIVRWSYDNKPDVPSNVKLMQWVPQSDVLGHKNTQLFLTHCGANGQFEALYHGVPMINFPSFGDQPYNAKRADYHGFSETMDVNQFTAKQLYDTMMKILSEPSYRDNIQLASSVFRAQPMSPSEKAAFWVEHVIQFGGDHLRSHALDMPGYQYLMLDIFAFLLAGICAGVLVLYLVLSCGIKQFCRSGKQDEILDNNNDSKKLKKQ